MTQINPYLTLNGNCREVMSFYKECLGGELTLLTVQDSPMASQCPAAIQTNILHAMLAKDALVIFGSDMGGAQPVIGNMVSLSLTCKSLEEAQLAFSNLSAGGKVSHPLHDFFAGTLGSLTDKFGINWMVYFAKQQ